MGTLRSKLCKNKSMKQINTVFIQIYELAVTI